MKKKMKKIMSLLLALTMVVTITAPASAIVNRTFKDVPKSQWYARYVYGLVDAGIVDGTNAALDQFTPNGTLTRDEFLKMLINSLTTSEERKATKGKGYFSDVAGRWSEEYVNLAMEKGIINANDAPNGKFNPGTAITRMDAAVWMYRLSKAFPEQVPLTPKQSAMSFTDMRSASGEVLEAVTACSRASIITGYEDYTFRPQNFTKRSEASKMVLVLFELPERPTSQIPDVAVYKAPTVRRSVVCGGTVANTVVELDPTQGYNVSLALANGKLDSAQICGNIRTAANPVVAVDGQVFDANQGNAVFSNMVSNGKLVRIDNAYSRPAFVIDNNGKASVQHSLKIIQRFQIQGTDIVTPKDVKCNYRYGASKDASWVLYTPEFGTSIPGATFYAITMDKNFKITKVYKNANNVPIPSNGYTLIQGKAGWDATLELKGEFISKAQVGTRLTQKLTYEGSNTQNVNFCLTAGPLLVKNGAKADVSLKSIAAQGIDSSSHVAGAGSRVAIGVKSNGTVVIAYFPSVISLATEASAMKDLGCYNAMNLDGGASCYLNVNGIRYATPGRNLNNLIVFSKK